MFEQKCVLGYSLTYVTEISDSKSQPSLGLWNVDHLSICLTLGTDDTYDKSLFFVVLITMCFVVPT